MSKVYISGETPAWVIDGVNKTFTTQYNAHQVEDLLVDGADYRGFTITNNIIVLEDAPTVSITIDYYYSSTNTDPAGITTKSQMRDRVYGLLVEYSDSDTYSTTEVDDMINEYENDVCFWFVVDITSDRRRWVSCDSLTFMETNIYEKTIEDVTTQSLVSAWDTAITIATTWLKDSGAVLINEMVISYTSKTSTQILWCDGVLIDIPQWSPVRKITQLPANYNNVVSVRDVERREDIPRRQEHLSRWQGSAYIIHNSNNKEYLEVQRPWVICKITLMRQASRLSGDIDNSNLPWEYAMKIIPRLVAGTMLWEKEEYEKWKRILMSAYASVKTLYSVYGYKNKWGNKKIPKKPLPFWFR